jgi:SAM-dependent methyltransferase
MDFEGYYRRNAAAHGGAITTSSVAATGRLPRRPSGTDWAVLWALEGHARRAPDAAVLDVGCAQLTVLKSLAGLFGRRVGVDVAVFEEWASHPDIETHRFNLDEGALPFPNGSFAFVTMLMVLEHVFDPFHAVREVRRVARPDGDVVLHVPNIAGIRHRIALARGRLPVTSSRAAFEEGAWDGQHIHQFTRASLAWLLAREGLEPQRWVVSGRFAQVRSRWPSLLGSDLIVHCRPSTPRSAPRTF